MANRRMFSLDVINTDNFMDMPISAQCLYFHLGMRADDDGLVSSPRQIIRMVSCTNDDLKVLISKGYVIPFESGVVVIRHWRQNNYLRCDRYTKSVREEFDLLKLEKGVYSLTNSDGIPCGIPTGNPDKIRLDENRLDENRKELCPELEPQTPDQSGILLPLVDGSMYDVPLSKIQTWNTAYPAVDIRQELREMIAWLDSNPQRRKTARGIDRFINSWLSKEQDRGGKYRNGQQTPAEPVREFKDDVERYSKYLKNCKPSPDDPFQ